MSSPLTTLLPDSDEPQPPPGEDLTGRDRMAWNVIASWAGHMIFVVAGFIMPRFIDRQLGQEELGVWDFGWSLVNYFSLAQIGIGNSVNRYVARYRAQQDVGGLNRAVASVMCIQLVAGVVVLMLTGVTAWLVPSLLNARLGPFVSDARWVVLLLGLSLAIQMFLNAYVGVVTGCHRWDLHNFVNAGSYAVTVVLMITTLCLGGGLRGLALASCVGTAMGEVFRVFVAYHVCPELRVRIGGATWTQGREMLLFGGKTLINSLSRLLLYQTNSMIIVGFLGPAALAVYSRSKSLVSNAQVFVNKFAFVLTPTTGALQADGRQRELRELAVRTGRFATYLSLPIVLLLVILGDPILQLWMGPGYRPGVVLAILAIGHLAEMTRQPVTAMLTGMNLHGRLAIANLLAALCSVGLGLVLIGATKLGLVGAALAIAIPLILVNGTFVPVYACRCLGMPVREYLLHTNRGPLLCAVPFALCLLIGRFCFTGRPFLALLCGAGGGGLVLGVLYWQCVLPARIRNALIGRFGRVFGRIVWQQA